MLIWEKQQGTCRYWLKEGKYGDTVEIVTRFERGLVIGHTSLGTRQNDRTKCFLVFGDKWNLTKTGLFDYGDSRSLFVYLPV
jgi:hypothetical protein